MSLAELTGTNYTIIRNVFVLTTNSNFASLTYLHNLHTRFCMPLMHACTDQLTLCILMCQKVIQITMQNLKKIGSEMSERERERESLLNPNFGNITILTVDYK